VLHFLSYISRPKIYLMKADELIHGLRQMIDNLDKQYAIKKKEVDNKDIKNKEPLYDYLNITASKIMTFKILVQETLKLSGIDYSRTFSECAHTSNEIVTDILSIKVNDGQTF